MTSATVAQQIAALPVRLNSDGTLSVLLITSRETRRWLIPKGWPWPGEADHVAAAGEARDEAGVLGNVRTELIGSYAYEKRQPGGPVPVQVTVYLLEVTEELASWPERNQRERAWFTPAEGAAAVQEPELAALIGAVVGLHAGR